MRAYAASILLVLLSIPLGACEDLSHRFAAWAKVMESGLGAGYYYVSEGGEQTFVIKSTTEEYEGKGLVVIPPEVVRVDSDGDHVVAATAHCATVDEFFERQAVYLTGEGRCYWIIDKEAEEVLGPLDPVAYERARESAGVSERLTL
jgi:hypothetical protein